MQQTHKPANAEERDHKPGEAIEAVAETFAISTFGGKTEQDAGDQSEEESGLKMIEVEGGHGSYSF